MQLDATLIADSKRRIAEAIIPAMADLYDRDEPTFPDDFRPGLKRLEKIVSYYDYYACGISALAGPAVAGDATARRLIDNVLRNCDYYRQHIHNQPFGDRGDIWRTPLRRLLLHLALAYRQLGDILSDAQRHRIRELVSEQVNAAIKVNQRFLPGQHDLHLTFANNHTAIFMQGIWYCGQVFDRPDWCDLTREFAERFYASGHPDGYWEENTNEQREGGPSLVYTRLTAGCLYDVLDGVHQRQEKFVAAGNLFRSLLNSDYWMIRIADERTNAHSQGFGYGAALHSLTPAGRGFIVDMLKSLDWSAMNPEQLAVVNHELDIMVTGEVETPECRRDGCFRITLPLGVIRKHGYTAGISAMRALNRELRPHSDYALDQQAMVYLSHEQAGEIITGFKSKANPAYSTFRIGDDAYTSRTGHLEINDHAAHARLHYDGFQATITWQIDPHPRLTLTVDTDKQVTTTLTVGDVSAIRSATRFEHIAIDGFSPYTAGNKDETVQAIQFHWYRELVIDFDITAS